MGEKRKDVSHLAKFFIWLTVFGASLLFFMQIGPRSIEHGHAGHFFASTFACAASLGAAVGALFGRATAGWVVGSTLFASGFVVLSFVPIWPASGNGWSDRTTYWDSNFCVIYD